MINKMQKYYKVIFLKLVLGAFLVIPVSQVGAALLSLNSSFGVDTITRDSDTGLEWLDVTLSTNISFDTIVTQFGSGSEFEDFRHATSSQISGLFTNSGISGPFDIFSIVDLQELVGAESLSDISLNWRTEGWAGDLNPSDPSQRFTGRLRAVFASSQPSFSSDASLNFAPVSEQAIADPRIGHWLVRISPVPLPPTLYLMGSLLPFLMLISRQRRRQTGLIK